MSNCLDENDALATLEGRLDSTARARVERHLESCNACRELVAELARVEAEDSSVPDTERMAGPPGNLTRVGPYRIEREVGSGSAGRVYRAVDERTGQVVALKIVDDPSWRTRFGREAETLSRIQHPCIVRYVGHGETPHGMVLAMEWLDGEDLEQRLQRGPLPWPAARALGLRLSSALAHAHAHDVIHRDLSTRNVFLPAGRPEEAKLLDFGLVRVHDALERTASQAVLGTPYYMAPEQVKDPRRIDARADLFALGVVLHEALSGARPFVGDDLFTVWLRIVDQPAPDLRMLTRGVPEPFIVLVEQLLAKEPAQRPASASEVHQRLTALERFDLAGESSLAPTVLARPFAGGTCAHPPAPGPFGSHSGGPHVFVDSRPMPIVSARPPPSAVPPRRGSGAVVVAAGVGVTALVAASTLAVVATRPSRRDGSSERGGSELGAAVSSAPAPSAVQEGEPSPPPSEQDESAAGSRSAQRASGSPETLFCGGDDAQTWRGGSYRPDPAFPGNHAVVVAARCKTVLEDCVIAGPRSVMVLGQGELTLRRCRVLGEVKLVGSTTLILEGTNLPRAPNVTGSARIVRK